VWARTELDGGEGLDWDPRQLSIDETAATRDIRRFWDSVNLDVEAPAAGLPYALHLTNLVEDWTGSGSINDPADIAASSDFVFVADGAVVRMFDEWYNAPNSRNIAHVVQQLAVSSSGECMAVGTAGQVSYQAPGGASFAQIYTPTTSFVRAVWFAKGRFVAFRNATDGTAGELGELASDGTFTVFDTTGEDQVYSVVSSGSALVSAVSDGTLRSYVPEQGNQADPTSVNVVIRGRTDMPKGEIPYVLGSEGGVLTILTIDDREVGAAKTARFYRAEILSSQYDYTAGGLQLQREWIDSEEEIHVQNNMSSVRDAIYFTISEADGNSYTWRYDLTTLGLSRHNTVAVTRDGTYATVVFNERGATIDYSIAGTPVIRLSSDTEINPSGYLISPNITFGLNTDIAWMSSILEATNVSGVDYVDLWRTEDPEAILDPYNLTDAWVHVQRVSDASQSGVEIPIQGVTSRTLALRLAVYSGGDDSPQITRTAVRGIPTHRDWIVLLPVSVSDMVEVPGRMPTRVPYLGNDLQQEVLQLVGQSVYIEVLNPPMTFRGVIDNVDEPVEYISDRGSASVYCMVQFRGLRVTSTIQPVGEGLGVARLGIATLGVGESTSIPDIPPVLGAFYGDYATGYYGTE